LQYGNNTVAQKLPYGKISDTQNLAHIDNIDIQEKKDISKKTKSKDKPALSLPFSSDKFIETWNALCEEKNWKGKTQKALQLTLNKLGRYAEEFAIELMEKTIENGWKGVVFSDTDAKYQEWQSERQRRIDNAMPRTSQPATVNSKLAEMQARLARMREQAQHNEEP
jgi:hypothetical protein